MHELGATQNVVNILLKEATERKLQTIHQVSLELGVLTTYEPKPFLYYFDLLKEKEAVLQNALLEITTVPGKLHCENCNKESLISSAFELQCNHCQSSNVNIIAGQDIQITTIEAE